MTKELTDDATEKDIHRFIYDASEEQKEMLIEKSIQEFVLYENKLLLSAVIRFSDANMLRYITQHSYAKDVIANAVKGYSTKRRGAPKKKKTILRNNEIIYRIYHLNLEHDIPISSSAQNKDAAFSIVAKEYHLSIDSIKAIWKKRCCKSFKSLENSRKIKKLFKKRSFLKIALGGQLPDHLEGG